MPKTLDAATAVPTATPQKREARLSPTPAPTATQVEVQDEAEGVVRQAREDLAQRIGMDTDRIRLVTVEEMEWSDSSLGCPSPGMMYAQVVTPGFRVRFEAGRQEYEYHTDAAQLIVLCPEEPHSREESETMTDTPVLSQGDLPIFIEMTQATLLRSARSQSAPVAGRPNSVFAFFADTRTLLLRSAITVAPTTEVLIGLTQVIQGPTGELVMGRLFQVPASGTPPLAEVDLAVADIERETARLRLVYRGEILGLTAGQSRTFKRTLADQGSVEITTITNRGRLADMGSLPGERNGS
jgi:hypothetical protein